MYSMQHVLWRGAMALSLMVVGGFGAYSAPTPRAIDIACNEAPRVAAIAVAPAKPVAFQHVRFDTVVVYAIAPKDA